MSATLGKYELRQVLGKGAMGTVYEGFDPIIHRKLAIKTVRLPEAEDVEAQAAGRLSHPNIVGVFDYGETPELAYIVMEFVDGTTLRCLIPDFDGAIFSLEWREALWARFFTGAPQRQRRSVERYSIVKRA